MKRFLLALLLVWGAVSIALWPYGWLNGPFLALLILVFALLLMAPPLLLAELAARVGLSVLRAALVAALAAFAWVPALSAAGATLDIISSEGSPAVEGLILFAILEGLIAYLVLPVRSAVPR